MVFLFGPTVVCAQVITPPGEEEVVPQEALPWQNNEIKNKIIPLVPNMPTPQGPPYGTIVMMQKPIACNDTPVVTNFIQNAGGMTPLTFGTNLNEMGAIISLIQVYANPVNKQFAIVEHFAAQKSCIIAQGHDFDIILPKQRELQQ